SLEIQLPFLQRVVPALAVVPVLVGADEGLVAIAAGLRDLDDGRTLFIVSSDFTHYGASFEYLPFPATGAEAVSERLRELDFGAIELVCRLDAEGFRSYVFRTGATICGRAAIGAFLYTRPTGLAGTVASYYTSLDVTGDYEHSVSYATVLFLPADAPA
ncbi:MAG: AmmeMemoRadiSam system protein B, partial [Candidatus Binatia bacterium]